MSDVELEQLERQIATRESRISVVAECAVVTPEDGSIWSDTSRPDDWRRDLRQELRYLELRGLIERHPEHPEWVQVRAE